MLGEVGRRRPPGRPGTGSCPGARPPRAPGAGKIARRAVALPRERLDHFGARLLHPRSLLSSLEHAPVVGDALVGREAAGQEKAPSARFARARYRGLKPHPTPLGRQSLGVLDHAVADAAVSHAALDHQLLDGPEPTLEPQNGPG